MALLALHATLYSYEDIPHTGAGLMRAPRPRVARQDTVRLGCLGCLDPEELPPPRLPNHCPSGNGFVSDDSYALF